MKVPTDFLTNSLRISVTFASLASSAGKSQTSRRLERLGWQGGGCHRLGRQCWPGPAAPPCGGRVADSFCRPQFWLPFWPLCGGLSPVSCGCCHSLRAALRAARSRLRCLLAVEAAIVAAVATLPESCNTGGSQGRQAGKGHGARLAPRATEEAVARAVAGAAGPWPQQAGARQEVPPTDYIQICSTTFSLQGSAGDAELAERCNDPGSALAAAPSPLQRT